MRDCGFAIPGDHRQKTGGFIYERRLLEELQAQGRAVRHLRLPPFRPDPPAAERRRICGILAGLPPGMPLILDGLSFAAMAPGDLAALGRPVIAMLHHPAGTEQGLPAPLAARLLAQERANLALAAHVVVTSPHSRDTYIGMGADPARLTVALPGHDGPRGAPREEAGPRILSVGLLARRKGHDVLIRALARIADLDWTARIVGKTHDPAVKAELAALIAAHDLQARVTLAGELSDAALARDYRRARIFALATRHEGYGMALAEALCHGLPVVSCDAGAVPGTLAGAGLLAAPEDAAGIAGHLRRLLEDVPLRSALSRRAEAEARALPRWRDTAAVMGGVLDRL
ncbi:glycosyltransferase family 4 protein [Mangrovicoccus algicola]|uniref:Glycosyltransferase family 4 protein n=1 Tax=Mangrovicoccus algicola TaxID=2771008 RepID=A0A8J6Z0M1_9RHOB|nr:glycosyltransferase family 4 protein [Mangrovicoccus algicola]MBE3640414.1 glycosyltransferase family 4 protein [Mangrovicoccus algicola]